MPAAAPAKTASLMLVWGEDDFAVKQRARKLYQQWSEELGGMDHETIDGAAGNTGEAIKALGRLREALQTLPFFGSGKVVWLRDCNFLADDRTSASQTVTNALAALAQELKVFSWQGVRLLISAGAVDKRRTFYKTIEKLGTVETFGGWSLNDKDWANEAELYVRRALADRKQEITDAAVADLVSRIGPNARQLNSEVEKLSLYAAGRPEITAVDVEAICASNKFARAFALGDAFGERNLPKALSCLDEELWEMQFDKEKSEFGLLAGLTGKVRVMLLLKEMIREGWLKPTNEYNRFKSQLERVPADQIPADKRYNPLAMHPFLVFKTLQHAGHYASEELVRAMELLLQCNLKFFSRTDATLALQQTLVRIISRPEADDAPKAR